MPAYGIANNLPKFRPFSFQEYIAPYEKYGQAYKEQETALEQLSSKAMQYEKLANNAADREQYEQYKSYANALKAQASDLATNGLSIGSRRALVDLKSQYYSDIVPIEEAYKLREEESKLQREAFIKSGGKVRYSQDAGTLALSKYLNGQRPNYNMANLDDIYKESAAGAQAISKRYFTKPQIESLNKQYLLYTQQMGMSSARALEELEKKDSEFGKFAQSMRDRYKYSSFSAGDQVDMDASIRGGILTGLVNEVDYKPLQDGEYVNAADRFSQTLAMRQLALAEAEKGATYNKDTKTYDIDPTKQSNNIIQLPDGSIAAPVKGSNGQWKVTHPDGTSELKDKKEIMTKATTHPKPENFEPIDFEYQTFSDKIALFTGNRGLLHNNYFSRSDAKPISTDMLTDAARERLMVKLADYDLTLNDIDLYRDHDIFSRNAYRIVYKGDDINGNTPKKEGTPATPQEQPKPTTYGGNF